MLNKYENTPNNDPDGNHCQTADIPHELREVYNFYPSAIYSPFRIYQIDNIHNFSSPLMDDSVICRMKR